MTNLRLTKLVKEMDQRRRELQQTNNTYGKFIDEQALRQAQHDRGRRFQSMPPLKRPEKKP